jgi:hypothetical protein
VLVIASPAAGNKNRMSALATKRLRIQLVSMLPRSHNDNSFLH